MRHRVTRIELPTRLVAWWHSRSSAASSPVPAPYSAALRAAKRRGTSNNLPPRPRLFNAAPAPPRVVLPLAGRGQQALQAGAKGFAIGQHLVDFRRVIRLVAMLMSGRAGGQR